MTVADPASAVTDQDPDPGLVGTRTGDGADDPVTGQVPAIELHDGRLRVHAHRDVLIVTLDGGLDADLADELTPVLGDVLAGADAVILDIDQVALLDQAGFETLARTFDEATDAAARCIVVSRLSGRMVLERWGVTVRWPLFTSVADALQARAFAANGYGEGWRPVP